MKNEPDLAIGRRPPAPRTTLPRRGPRHAWTWSVGCAVALVLGCSGANKEGKPGEPELGKTTAVGSSTPEPEEPAQEAIELGEITKSSFREHPAKSAWVIEPGAEPKKMPIGVAEAKGFTIVDLSNGWTPYIFSEKTPGAQDETANNYRKMYIGLANDRIDSDGDKLREHQHNYLELYGIPPSLNVVATEWEALDTDLVPCLEAAGFDRSVFAEFSGKIVYRKSSKSKAHKNARYYRAQLNRRMRKAKLDPQSADDLLAAKTNPKTKRMYAKWREYQGEVDVIDHAQRRFRCERMFNDSDGRGRFEAGIYDSPTTHALARFERKHDVMGWGHFKADNLAMLGLSPEEAVHQRLLRVLQERVVSSAGIVEDGSAAQWKKGKFSWKDSEGESHGLRDLATEFTDAAVTALDLQTPESAKASLARLSDLGDGEFENLLVAIKMPSLPEYYAENMEFETVIDRGDVWYDFPYDDAGNKKGQPRSRFPHITVYTRYNEQRIPLIHWRTTIGSWRNEVKDGEVMLKYKNSDVGDRVWKDIVAAPVWIPPATTPPAELVKGKWKNGKFRRGVNYDEIGPGFRSAYGLVAAYHIKQNVNAEGEVVSEFDNSIRTHGSVDYMSILRRFSHGCHRLYNMDAVRLFSFVLRHREYARKGQVKVGVGRHLQVEERSYHMKIGTRGYKYELVEPIPVTVTAGRIRGRRRSPVSTYVPKPIKEEDLAEGDDTAVPAMDEAPAQPASPM